MKNLKQYTFIILTALAIASCEKEEDTIENTNIDNQEESQAIVHSEVVLSKSYDANLNKEERSALFKKDIAAYMSTQKKSKNRSGYTEWYTEIVETTGPDQEDESNGEVQFKAYYTTNTGYIGSTNWGDLPLKEGYTYRDVGYNRSHLIKSYINQTLEWIEADDVKIRLKGTDDWLLSNLYMEINSNTQGDGIYAYGYSYSAQNILNDQIRLNPGCGTCYDEYSIKNEISVTKYGKMHFD